MRIQKCPICNSSPSNSAFAVISPWVRALGVVSFPVTRYFMCTGCRTGYFSKRYLPTEMDSIYRDYREERYLNARSDWEPWYSASYNGGHDSQELIASRVGSLAKFLAKHIEQDVHSVVDVGGDQGQFIPDFAKVKIVYDLSDRPLLAGVVRAKSLEDLPSVDLIIYAHVLEHVAFPLEEVTKLLEKAHYVYVEVPFGVPEITKPRKNLVRVLMHILASYSRRKWRRQAAPSSGRSIKTMGMLSQSEHLTFFSESSIEVLASLLGVSFRLEKSVMATPDKQVASVLQCLLFKG